MKIGIGLKESAYTPEAYAYADYLKKQGWSVQLEQETKLDPSLDLHIYFMGLKPFWKNEFNKCKVEIHEYQSLSIPPYARFKDIVKKCINRKPNGRIFLNETVKKNLFFKDGIPSLNRDMGIDERLFLNPPINPFYDLIYSGTISSRPGIVDTFFRLAKINLKILIVGEVKKEIRDLFSSFKNVHFSGRVSRHELPELYQNARAGLNFTPDLFPFNIQTSTKTIEYCAANLGVVSNNYKWIRDFKNVRKSKFLWLEDLNSIDDLHNFKFIIPDVKDLEWFNLLDNIKFDNFLRDCVIDKDSFI